MGWNGMHWTAKPPRQWYKSRDVARVLQVTVRTVQAWVRAGKLQAERVGPHGQLRFAASDVMRWVGRRGAA